MDDCSSTSYFVFHFSPELKGDADTMLFLEKNMLY